jgi:hypothetical protein
MTVRTHTFPLTGTPRAIEVRNPSGSVTVRAVDDAAEVVVRVEALDGAAGDTADRVDVDATASRVRVSVPERRLMRNPALAIEVTTPPGAAVRVAVASAEVELRGRLGRTEVTGASRDVSVEHCTELELRSASGDVQVGLVERAATVATASGDVRLDAAGGPVLVRTASGDVTVGDAGDDVSVTSASGDVGIDRALRGTVQLKTVSADARVAVEPGLRVWLDVQSVSGRLYSDLDDDGPDAGTGAREADLAVVLQSVSGDLRVRRAIPRAPVS